jgi:tRNA(Arg) A34 adenosine deaminase TadA
MIEKERFTFFDLQKDKEYLRRGIEISWESVKSGNTPFGALLVDGSGTILLEQPNIEISEKDCTGHAETTLMRKASKIYSKDLLKDCTLYTTAEPCVMCAGAIYWGNVGRVVYAISEKRLLELTGSDPQNPTFDVPCRTVFAGGQKDIVVVGPIDDLELEVEAAAPHQGFWENH